MEQRFHLIDGNHQPLLSIAPVAADHIMAV